MAHTEVVLMEGSCVRVWHQARLLGKQQSLEGRTEPSFHKSLIGEVMKKVILAVLLTAFALFLILPSLSWAQEDIYKAKCAACHGADGKGTAAGKKMGALEF